LFNDNVIQSREFNALKHHNEPGT